MMITKLQILLSLCAISAAKYKVVDLTRTLNAQSHTWPTNPAYEMTNLHNYTGEFMWYDNVLTFAEHTGTHIDAPFHFSNDPNSYFMDTIPVERLVCPLTLLNLREKAAAEVDYNVQPQDIYDHEEVYGRIPPASVVLVDFGWAKKDYVDYLGSNGTDPFEYHFPGISIEAGKLLVERGIYGYGADTLSTDCGRCAISGFPLHHYFAAKNIYLIENVDDMSELPAGGKGATLVVGSMKHVIGSGGPARLIAIVESNSASVHFLSGVVVLLTLFSILF